MWTFSFVMFWIWAAAMLLALWAVRVAQRFGFRLPRIAQEPVIIESFPRVAVILPIKGVEDDTHQNIQALLEQDYPHYRLIFTVESDQDPVLALLEKIATEDSRVEIVVAGLAQERGQKIHNQLAAVARTNDRDDILAFMDADARPAPHWLTALISPLTYGDNKIGASTGYRYYIPVTPHTANKIVSVLNAEVAALFGPFRRTLAWGGSMAIRRSDFFSFGLSTMWQKALSDDYVLSHCVKAVNKKNIHFVPQCLVASDANFNWASLFEFAVRQYRITKVCELWIWLLAVGGSLVFLSAFAFTGFNAVYGFINPAHFPPGEHGRQIAMFSLLYAAQIVRGFFLVLGGERLLPQHKAAIRTTYFWATLGIPWCYLINLLALLGSAFGRNIIWRNVAYQMLSRTRTLVHRPHAGTQSMPHRERAKTRDR